MAAKKIKDEKILEALMTSRTVSAAAEKCEVARSTVYERLKDPDFSKLLTAEILKRRRAVNALSTRALEAATERLLELLEEPGVNDTVRMQAISAALKAFL